MFEDFSTMRTAKKHGRTFEQQEYRDKLAKTLKELKKEWKTIEELDEFLSNKQRTIEYAENQISCWRTLNGDLAKKLIDSWKLDFVIKNLNKFKWLSKSIAAKLFEEWYYLDVARNIMSFEILDEELAWKLIENHCWRFVARNPDRFEWLNHEKVAEILINRWYGDELAMNLNKFKWLNHNAIAKKLLNREWWWYWYWLKNFKWLDDEVAWTLITRYPLWCRRVAYSLKSFEWLSNKTAMLMIKKVLWKLEDYEMWKYLEDNLKSFDWLSSDTIEFIHRLAHPRSYIV